MLLELERKTTKYIDNVIDSVSSQTFTNYVAVADGGNKIVDFINLELDKQIDDIQQSDISTRMGLLKIKLLLESKDMVVAIGKVLVTYKEFSASVQKEARSKTLSK
jgi:hypothetical protein